MLIFPTVVDWWDEEPQDLFGNTWGDSYDSSQAVSEYVERSN